MFLLDGWVLTKRDRHNRRNDDISDGFELEKMKAENVNIQNFPPKNVQTESIKKFPMKVCEVGFGVAISSIQNGPMRSQIR